MVKVTKPIVIKKSAPKIPTENQSATTAENQSDATPPKTVDTILTTENQTKTSTTENQIKMQAQSTTSEALPNSASPPTNRYTDLGVHPQYGRVLRNTVTGEKFFENPPPGGNGLPFDTTEKGVKREV